MDDTKKIPLSLPLLRVRIDNCQASHEAALKEVKETIKDVTRTLRGWNGEVGLVAEVKNMKEAITEMKRINYAVFAALVVNIIVQLFNIGG